MTEEEIDEAVRAYKEELDQFAEYLWEEVHQPLADQMRAHILARVAQGESMEDITDSIKRSVEEAKKDMTVWRGPAAFLMGFDETHHDR